MDFKGLFGKRFDLSMKRTLPLLFALLLLLAGCVEYDEELWLNPDGSGKVKLRLAHRSHFDNTQVFIDKEDSPGIHLISRQTSRVGDRWVYEVYFKFDSIEAFNNVNDQLAAADFWGSITLNKTPEGNIVFKRRISLGNQSPDSTAVMLDPEDPYSMEDDFDILESIAKEQADKPVWNYKLHVPWKIVGSNANQDNIDAKGKTLNWSYDTSQMWNKYEEMTVEMKKGISWLMIVLFALVFLLLAFFVAWLFRISKRSHLHDVRQHKKEHLARQEAEKSNPEQTEQ